MQLQNCISCSVYSVWWNQTHSKWKMNIVRDTSNCIYDQIINKNLFIHQKSALLQSLDMQLAQKFVFRKICICSVSKITLCYIIKAIAKQRKYTKFSLKRNLQLLFAEIDLILHIVFLYSSVILTPRNNIIIFQFDTK